MRAAHVASSTAFRILEDIASRIQSYVAAEAEFVDRWDNEKLVVADKLDEMENLRQFYEGYASAYDTLILEAERRRAVEDKIQAIWRKAKDTVDKLADADQKERDMFRHEIGEYLPTDLWVGMTRPLPRWELVPIVHGDDDDDGVPGPGRGRGRGRGGWRNTALHCRQAPCDRGGVAVLSAGTWLRPRERGCRAREEAARRQDKWPLSFPKEAVSFYCLSY